MKETMTEKLTDIFIKQWIEKHCIAQDLEYLRQVGFFIQFEEIDDDKFFLRITDGDEVEFLRSPREIEKVVNIIKMYKGLNK